MFCVCSKSVVLFGTLQVRCLLQLSRFQVHTDMSTLMCGGMVMSCKLAGGNIHLSILLFDSCGT